MLYLQSHDAMQAAQREANLKEDPLTASEMS